MVLGGGVVAWQLRMTQAWTCVVRNSYERSGLVVLGLRLYTVSLMWFEDFGVT